MTARPIVLRSIETEDGLKCVDIFQRADGSFGFAEYRRDFEEAGGWRPLGHFGDLVYPDDRAALDAARSHVPWLAERNAG